MPEISIDEVRFIAAPAKFQATGLLGWASCNVDGVLGMALGVRRTRTGRVALSFPAHTDSRGRVHHQCWPLSDEARRAIEAQVIGELQRSGKLPPGPYFDPAGITEPDAGGNEREREARPRSRGGSR